MSKRAWFWGVLFLLFSIGLGCLLPTVVFSRARSQTLEKVEYHSVTPLMIGTSNTILDAMQCSYYGGYTFSYDEELANLSKQQVLELCTDFLQKSRIRAWQDTPIQIEDAQTEMMCEMIVINVDKYFQEQRNWEQKYIAEMEAGFDTENSGEMDENSFTKDTISAVLWKVTVELAPNCIVCFHVDDRNAKVVRMSAYTDEERTDSEENKDNLWYLTQTLVPWWGEYYNVEVEIVEDRASSFVVNMTDQNEDSMLMSISFPCGIVNMETV